MFPHRIRVNDLLLRNEPIVDPIIGLWHTTLTVGDGESIAVCIEDLILLVHTVEAYRETNAADRAELGAFQ